MMKPFQFIFIVITAGFFSLAVKLNAQAPIEMGDVVGSARVTERSIVITGEPASLVRSANRLFDMHGGFKRVSDAPDFTLRFNESGPKSVRMTIFSAGKELWTTEVEDTNQTAALYRAADAAVRKLLGIPGFFGSQLAFISNRTGHTEVYLADMLFQSVRQLTRDNSQCLSPALSPDGNTLLYTSYHGTGFPDLYKIDLRTGRRTVFAGFKGTNTGAAFSPDGRRVAMILSGSGNSEVYTSSNTGHQLRRLTRSSSLEADPGWSPDGREIIFTSDQLGGPQIYRMDVQGRSMSRVRTDISRNCSEPVWNPLNRDQIAFTAAMGGDFEVVLFSFSEGKSRVLSRGAGDAVHPAWLRDGRHLIYTERTGRNSGLMILDTLTRERFRLSPVELNDASGTSIAYPGD